MRGTVGKYLLSEHANTRYCRAAEASPYVHSFKIDMDNDCKQN